MADNLGEWIETKKATEEIQRICDWVKTQVEEKTKKKYVEFKAVEYRSERPEVGNYLIKVHVGGKNYIHLIVSVLPLVPETKILLLSVQQDKTKDDPLVPFKG